MFSVQHLAIVSLLTLAVACQAPAPPPASKDASPNTEQAQPTPPADPIATPPYPAPDASSAAVPPTQAEQAPSTPPKATPDDTTVAADALQKLGNPSETQDFGSPLDDARALEAAMKVKTEPGDIPRLSLEVDGKRFPLPLEHTHVKANIVGYVSQVEVTQTYANPFDYPIETIYVFPLPENSAVNDMKIVIGERVIEAEIKKRQEARELYETAKQEGHTAALLEQERPNVFTQSVANVAPGEKIKVVIAYAQTMTYDAGEYEWVFPMVVGPRFVPGNPTGASGSGWSPDTDQVPDGSRITPPIVGGGMRTGHDISLELTAHTGFPIIDWSVPTHEVAAEAAQDGVFQLALAEKDSIPNRDFVLRYKLAAAEPAATVLAEHDGKDGYFTLILQPPALELDTLVGKRELIFVVDISGSMWGKPMAMCKDAMTTALRMMQPVDTFNIITFASGEKLLWSEPRPANDANIKDAMSFIDGLVAGGGTMMSSAVQAALSNPVEQGRHRYVFFLTDGYVGNEAEILNQVSAFTSTDAQGKKRVFGFGVGSSVNRMLLDGMGTQGNGATVYATNREDPTRAVHRYYSIIDHPIATDLSIDWGGLEVSELLPVVLPDFLASRPVVIHGRYSKPGTATIRVTGKSENSRFELPVSIDLPGPSAEADKVLGVLWARAKIDELSRDLWDGDNQQIQDSITQLGLDYRIVTAFTSLIAVDRSRTVGQGEPTTIVQPVDLAEDVSSMAYPQQAQLAKPTRARAPSGAKYDKSAEALPSPAEAMETVSPEPAPSAEPKKDETHSNTPAAQIRLTLRVSMSDFQKCYEERKVEKPELAGKLLLKLEIGADGKVAKLSFENDTLGDPKLLECLRSIIEKLDFGLLSAPISVSYPLVFK
ncbi:MAG: VIT domain-containing protein [Myxococcota bacterium]|jgi:Ca-activated chloride channel family protein|nr:VIT domain-containing protein [Myxococcota bacterium]